MHYKSTNPFKPPALIDINWTAQQNSCKNLHSITDLLCLLLCDGRYSMTDLLCLLLYETRCSISDLLCLLLCDGWFSITDLLCLLLCDGRFSITDLLCFLLWGLKIEQECKLEDAALRPVPLEYFTSMISHYDDILEKSIYPKPVVRIPRWTS